MNKYIFLIILFLVTLVVVNKIRINRLKEKLQISQNNEKIYMDGVEYYKTKDSLNVASVGVLELNRKELKERNKELIEEIEHLNIKLKRVKSVASNPIRAIGSIDVKLKDTIILQLPQKKYNFDDGYLKQVGFIRNDSLIANYTYQDTLIQIIHRIPRKIWFIKFGTKSIKQEVYMKNKNTKINAPIIINIR